MDSARSISRCGMGFRPTPRADWATKLRAMTDARADGQRVRLGWRHAGLVAAVHEEAPDLLEANSPYEFLDVDPPVAKRVALLVGFGDRGVEGDDALEAGGDLDQVSHGPGPRPRRGPA